MRCRMVICAACCTRVNGINHCHACLKALGDRREEKHSAKLGILLAGLLFGIAWLALFGMCWAVSGLLAP
jgi:uncharacterized membrane protein YkvI